MPEYGSTPRLDDTTVESLDGPALSKASIEPRTPWTRRCKSIARWIVLTLVLASLTGRAPAAPPEGELSKSPFLDQGRATWIFELNETEVGRETATIHEDGWTCEGSFDIMGAQARSHEASLRRLGPRNLDYHVVVDSTKPTEMKVDLTILLDGAKANASILGRGEREFEIPYEGDAILYEDLMWTSLIEVARAVISRVRTGELEPGGTLDTMLLSGGRVMKSTFKESSVETHERNGKPVEIWTIEIDLLGLVPTRLVVDESGIPLDVNIPTQKLRVRLEGYDNTTADPEPITLVDAGPWREKLSKAEHEVIHDKKLFVTARDGVKLAVDVVRPASEGSFPVILLRTPYSREMEALAKGSWWAKRGYVFVAADVRGRFDSEGDWIPLVHEANDGSDTIDWIVEQPWCDGNVGMIGASYAGWTQWYAARTGNPHLKAIVPQVAPPDPDQNIPYEGGSLMLLSAWWAKVAEEIGNGNFGLPDVDWLEALSTLPLSDLDDALGITTGFLDDWLAHPPTDEEYWKPMRYQDRFENMHVAALHISGWFDGDQPGAPQNFIGMRTRAKTAAARNAQYLILGPWSHAFNTTRTIGELDFGERAVVDLDSRTLRFFDRYLKGIDNGIARDPHVLYFNVGDNVWRGADDWPLPNSRPTPLYLASDGNANRRDGDGRLTLVVPQNAKFDTYRYDPRELPETNVNFDDMTGTETQIDISNLPDRNDVLDYTSPPLAEAVEITGAFEASLFVSTDAADTDYFVIVCELQPDGTLLPWASGIQRVRYRNGRDEPVAPGIVARITVDCWASSIRLDAGDRIRVMVSSSGFPGYARNLNTLEPIATTTKIVVAENRVHHGLSRASYVSLPVVSRKGSKGIVFAPETPEPEPAAESAAAEAPERESEASELEIAKRYLDRYTALDFDGIAAFYTDESTWEDPTGAEVGASTEPVRGRDAILAHLRTICQPIRSMNFDVERQFESGALVVSTGDFTMSLDRRSFGGSEGTVDVTVAIVIVLEVRDGKIRRHIDYTDFSNYAEKIGQALAESQGGD